MKTKITIVVMLGLLMAGVCPALAQEKKLRTIDSEVPVDLTPEQKSRLQDAWIRDGRPTLQIVVGQDVGGEVVDKGSALETQLRAAVQAQLGTGIDASRLVDATAVRTQQMRDLKSVAAQRGQDVSDALADVMRNTFESSLVMFVRLTPQSGGEYAVTMEVIDPASGSKVASKPFLNIEANPALRRINAYACSIAKHFLDQYADRVLSPTGALYTVRFRVIGLNNDEDADTLRGALQKTEGVVGNVEHSWEYAKGGIGIGAYTVTTKSPDPGSLRTAIRKAVREDMPGRGFFASRYGRGSMVGSILDLKTPKWWQVTNAEGDDADKIDQARTKRENARGLPRRLKLAVVIGSNLEGPAVMVEDASSTGPKADFDDAQFREELQSSFRTVGFDAVDSVSLAEAKHLAERQFNRFTNDAHFEAAVDDKKNFEYLLYGNVKTTAAGKQYEFRLVDRQSGTIVGTQRWPDARTMEADPKYRVEPSDPTAVARYVTGKLITQLDSRLLDNRLVMEVVVKNVDDVVKLGEISNEFKKVPNVSSVGTFNYSMPVGGFEIVYKGSTDELMAVLTDRLPNLDLPLDVDAFGDRQLVINLHRVVAPVKSRLAQERENKQVADSSAGKTLQQYLLGARASVFVVGVESANGAGFVPKGTAWTVAPNKLATNVHVVDAIAERLQNGGGRAVAKGGDNLSIVLELGKPTRHPGRDAWREFSDHIVDGNNLVEPFDVALIDVVSGDAGTPLKLATTDEMDALQPGDPVGYAGFPMEGKTNIHALPSLMQDIASISAYTNVFYQTRSKGAPGLIHYTLRSTGGASGSPVFANNGSVIGLNSAGDCTSVRPTNPVHGYVRLVVTSDGKFVRDGEQVLVAILSRPGKPMQVAEHHYVVIENDQAHTQRELINNEEKVGPIPMSDLIFDENGRVLAVLGTPTPRISTAFCYAQSVEMLKELLDGTVDAKQAVRRTEWEHVAAQLNILKTKR